MIRKIIHIDEEKCNGCGACAEACHEGAIGMVGGKAKLLRDDYCDGLGDCLPTCPTGAITFVEREAAAYDEAAVKAAQAKKKAAGGCPGCAVKSIDKEKAQAAAANAAKTIPSASHLRQWPVQIKLAPVNAPFFQGAKLLVAADCTAYAYGNFHEDFIKDHVTLIGCPKLDMVDYAEKLTAILANNDIRSITVTRMQVPCCGGIEYAVKKALLDSGKLIPWSVVTIAPDGSIVDRV
ncbi:MAG: 4Fe-4S binding protein [Christensenellaceae bacterium]|nr:4Fe-4S binding protein [Christensenellaceae bacterium]